MIRWKCNYPDLGLKAADVPRLIVDLQDNILPCPAIALRKNRHAASSAIRPPGLEGLIIALMNGASGRPFLPTHIALTPHKKNLLSAVLACVLARGERRGHQCFLGYRRRAPKSLVRD